MRYLFAIVLFSVSQFGLASTVTSTKIKSILAGEVYGNRVFLEVTVKPADSDKPSCQTNTDYNYSFDPSTEVGKVTMAMVLTAYASQKDVYLNGYGLCTTAQVEDLRQIWIK